MATDCSQSDRFNISLAQGQWTIIGLEWNWSVAVVAIVDGKQTPIAVLRRVWPPVQCSVTNTHIQLGPAIGFENALKGTGCQQGQLHLVAVMGVMCAIEAALHVTPAEVAQQPM